MNKSVDKRKLDQVIRCLTSAQRRQILQHLVEESRKDIERRELAEVLADTDSEFHLTIIQLKHRHLPILEDSGLVEYDSRSGAVRLTELIDIVEPLLEVCNELEQDLRED